LRAVRDKQDKTTFFKIKQLFLRISKTKKPSNNSVDVPFPPLLFKSRQWQLWCHTHLYNLMASSSCCSCCFTPPESSEQVQQNLDKHYVEPPMQSIVPRAEALAAVSPDVDTTVATVVEGTTGDLVSVNQYVLERRLGRGSYGTVMLAKSIADGRHYAIKVYYKPLLRKRRHIGRAQSSNQYDAVRREIAILRRLGRHPHVTRLVEVIDDPSQDPLFLVMEFCDGGSVMVGEVKETPLAEHVARAYFRHVLLGLIHIHSLRVAHRDIKSVRNAA
jgi:hypothetical protein